MNNNDSPDLLDLAEAVADGTLRTEDAERQLRAALGPDQSSRSDKAVRDLRQLIVAARAVRFHARATREAASQSPELAHAGASVGTGVPGQVKAGPVRRSTSRRADGRAQRRTWLLVAATIAVGAGLIGVSVVGSRPTAPKPGPTMPNTSSTASPATSPTASPASSLAATTAPSVAPTTEMTVSLGIYSGRPDPSWDLTEAQAAQVESAIEALPVTTGTPPQGGLGYHGFTILIRRPGQADEIQVAYRGTVAPMGAGPRTYRIDQGRTIERMLLDFGRPVLATHEIAAVEADLLAAP